MASKKTVLQIKELKKKYAEKEVLKGLNLQVEEGEFVVVIGPSGAGKSTLIRCLNRLVEPTGGTVSFAGAEMTKLSGKKLREARAKMGMIFQHYNLIGRTNVIKNVLHGRLGHHRFLTTLLGRYPEKEKQTALELLIKVGLGEHLYKKASELSGGQMQRVGICRAMIQEPLLLLADEPIASLDPTSAKVVMDHIYDLVTERNIACIMNLHQVEVAKAYATRIVGLKNGQIVYDGSPDKLTSEMIAYIYEGQVMDLEAGAAHAS